MVGPLPVVVAVVSDGHRDGVYIGRIYGLVCLERDAWGRLARVGGGLRCIRRGEVVDGIAQSNNKYKPQNQQQSPLTGKKWPAHGNYPTAQEKLLVLKYCVGEK